MSRSAKLFSGIIGGALALLFIFAGVSDAQRAGGTQRPGAGGSAYVLPSYVLTNNETKTPITFQNDLVVNDDLTVADALSAELLTVNDTAVVRGSLRVMEGQIFSNRTEYASVTNLPNANATNYWIDFVSDMVEINATTNIHFVQATNEPTENVVVATYIISTFGRVLTTTVSFATNVFSLTSTNFFNVRSNTLAVVSVINRRGTNRLASYNIQTLP